MKGSQRSFQPSMNAPMAFLRSATLRKVPRRIAWRVMIPKKKLRDSDHRLLEDVARQLGGVVHSSRLVGELRNILAKDGPDVDAQLLRLRTGIHATVLDVGRVVEGLRPPALDQLGFAGAVNELAQRLTENAHLPIQVHTHHR